MIDERAQRAGIVASPLPEIAHPLVSMAMTVSSRCFVVERGTYLPVSVFLPPPVKSLESIEICASSQFLLPPRFPLPRTGVIGRTGVLAVRHHQGEVVDRAWLSCSSRDI